MTTGIDWTAAISTGRGLAVQKATACIFGGFMLFKLLWKKAPESKV
jgi:hypothetical protein